jgi:hypothetical protein
LKDKKMKPKPAFGKNTDVAAPALGMKKKGKSKKSGKPFGMDNHQTSGHMNPHDLKHVSGGGPSMPPMGTKKGKAKKAKK